MRKLFSYIQKIGRHSYVCFSLKAGTKRVDQFKLKIGQVVVVEGGPLAGKTKFLKRLLEQIQEVGENVFFIDATQAVTKWFSVIPLPVKMTAARGLRWKLDNLPLVFYLLVDNAQTVNEGQKLETLLTVIEKARSVVVATRSFSQLHPRLQARMREAKVISLGCGADTFDITYFIVAIGIIVVALAGYHHLIYLAAALRYLFQGMRIGGRKI